MSGIGQPEPTHAGAVVFRPADGGPEVLLVTATGKEHEWVLPKGHIEPGEEAEAAAIREVREEAGIEIDVVTQLCRSVYVHEGETVDVIYFLARCVGHSSSSELRAKTWVSPNNAVDLLTYEENRDVMRHAKAELGRNHGPLRS